MAGVLRKHGEPEAPGIRKDSPLCGGQGHFRFFKFIE